MGLFDQVDDVMKRAHNQQQEFDALQTQLVGLQSLNEELQQENNDTRSRAAEYEQGYMNLLSELEDLKQKSQAEKVELLATTEAHAESADNQALYELESRLKAAEADKEVAGQDADRLQKELNALEGVLHDFQATSKAQVQIVRVLLMPNSVSDTGSCLL
jgi:chromosome segregation ATPase